MSSGGSGANGDSPWLTSQVLDVGKFILFGDIAFSLFGIEHVLLSTKQIPKQTVSLGRQTKSIAVYIYLFHL